MALPTIAETVQKCLDSYAAFASTCFYIRRKDGSVGPLTPNRLQWKVLETFNDPLRVVVLKPRQIGTSTWCMGYCLWRVLREPNRNALIVANKRETAQKLLNILQFGYRHLPAWFVETLGIETEYDTKYNLTFLHNGSSISIASPESQEPGRGDTIHFLHLAEAAFYADADTLTRAAFAAVPKLPGTAVIIESTGNGPAGFYYRRYHIAKRGLGGWRSTFLAWFEHEEYRIAGATVDEPDDYEKWLLSLGATEENLAWRRFVIESDYEGDPDKFRAEYPATEEEAFISSTATPFDPVMVQQRKAAVEKLAYQEGFVVPGEGRHVFVPATPGKVRVWKMPEPGRVYVIGADVGSGVGGPNSSKHAYSCADVLDATTGEQVAHLHEMAEPAVFAQDLEWLGRYYNLALLAPEVTGGHGLAVINALRDAGYPHLYRRKVFDRVQQQWQDMLGWNTSERTRTLIIDEMRADFRGSILTINCVETLNEMLSFIRNEKGRLEAVSGAQDDRVLSMAIANHARREYAGLLQPMAARERKEEAEQEEFSPYQRRIAAPGGRYDDKEFYGGVMSYGGSYAS